MASGFARDAVFAEEAFLDAEQPVMADPATAARAIYKAKFFKDLGIPFKLRNLDLLFIFYGFLWMFVMSMAIGPYHKA
jgi:hypothetical protein